MRRAVGLPERDGLLVRGVEGDSPAASAGLQEGDLIVRAGESQVSGLEDLQAALEGASGELVLGIVRGTEERSVTAKFASGS